MQNEKIKHLLNQVSSSLKTYDKIAKSTGENFNIFTVMGMESNEVKTHSAIIGELLNPRGSHGLGYKPLSLFIKLIVEPLYKKNDEEFANKFSFNYENTQSYVEDFAGKINEESTEGGRIDILIKDNKNKVFLIENKIYAGEQKNQLTRYKNYYPNAPILFLTLFGKDAESAQNLEKNKDYFIVSYELDIITWLEECLKEAVKYPMLREVISQYINLIKKLTNQTINNELKKEIMDLIKNNFIEASAIANNFEKVKTQIITEFWEKVKVSCNNLGDEWHIEIKSDLITRFNHILFHKHGNNMAYFYCRYNKNNGEVINGILLNPEIQNKIKCKDIFNNLDETLKLPGYSYGDQSIIWTKDKNYNFNNVDLISQMNLKGEEFAGEFADKIKSFIDNNKVLYNAILEYLNHQNK